MSDRKNRTYPEAFKLETLELLESSGKSTRQIERELGITQGLVWKWKKRYQVVQTEKEGRVLEPSDLEAAKTEIRRLQRELAEVKEEREILKKVVNIFSRRSG